MSLDLEEMRQHMRYRLLQFVSELHSSQSGDNILVLDPELKGLLEAVLMEMTEEDLNPPKPGQKRPPPRPLKELVKAIGVSELYDEGFDPDVLQEAMKKTSRTRRLLCVIRNSVDAVQQVLQAVPKDQKADILVVPRKTLIISRLLGSDLTEIDKRSLKELDLLDFVPWEPDVLTMECKMAFRDIALAGDTSLLFPIARALTKFQVYHGLASTVRAKGEAAVQVAGLMHSMQLQTAKSFEGQPSVLEALYIFDRRSDLLTPMMTQRTYEGLIDEVFGIENRRLEPGFTVEHVSKMADGTEFVPLTHLDSLYAGLRDTHFRVTGRRSKEFAVEIRKFEDSRKEMTSQGLKVMHAFMKELPKRSEQKSQISMHVSIQNELKQSMDRDAMKATIQTEYLMVCGDPDRPEKVLDKEILESIEDTLFRRDDPDKLLRLMCLYSQANGGVPKKQYDQWKQQLVQNYGLKSLLQMQNLEQCGLLRKQVAPGTLPQLKKELNLVQEFDPGETPDMSSTYAGIHADQMGFAPPLCRLVERAQSKDGKADPWGVPDQVLQLMPGPHKPSADDPPTRTPRSQGKVVVVCFIGGCTYAEISALRLLQAKWRKESAGDVSPPQIVVATTGIVTGRSLVQSCINYRRH